ncbi:MAG: hypothetical protein EOP48_28275 [Sphingobacteriales bacterium]|nr:MAG: hypothetical protein EOP48_28275 [Sphingobacteriales bacterium]
MSQKVTLPLIFLYGIVKYIIFYIFLMFKNNDYTLIEFGNVKTTQDLSYYVYLFLTLPIVFSICFSTPIYFSFKTKYISLFLAINCLVLAIEYFGYTYLASATDFTNGLYNVLISLLVFFLIFGKSIILRVSSGSRLRQPK